MGKLPTLSLVNTTSNVGLDENMMMVPAVENMVLFILALGSNGLLTNRIQECEDMREDCSMIIGYCMSHRKRMEQVCRKTCGYCRK